MKLQRNTSAISWMLGFLTLIVLILNIPERLDSVLGLWLLFFALTAFALNQNVLLVSGEISPAHMFGIMAFLTLGEGTRTAEAFWAVAAGALLGGLLQVARSDEWLPRRRVTVRSLATVAETMAQLTLTLLVAGAVYIRMGGRLPLGSMRPGDAVPLLAFSFIYVLVYLLFFALRVRLEGKVVSEVLRANWVALTGVVLLPVPFAILGAAIATDLDNLSWTFFIAGLVLVVVGVHGLSRTQFYYRQQVEELSSLSVVSQALRTSLELNSLLDTIYLQVAHLLSVDYFTVALLDPMKRTIHFPLTVRWGQRVKLPPREADDTLLDYVINNRAPLLIERRVAERALQMGLRPPEDPLYSWLGVPLLAPDRPLGAIAVASGDPEHPLSTADQRLLMNIAAQAGVAIDNAQLYGQARERALQLATLNSISALLTGTLSPEKVINLVASSAVAVASCDAVAVYLYTDRGDLELARNIGLSREFNEHPPDPLIVSVFGGADPRRLGRQPIVVADAHNDPQVDADRRELMDREGKRALLELFLIGGDGPLGVIAAYYDHPRAFGGDEIELMRTFAVQAALAINNARLYTTTDIALDRRVQQLQALYDIGQELTSILNLQKIFDLVLDRALEGTHSQAGGLVVGREDGAGIQVVASRGYPEGVFDNPLAIGGGVTAAVFETGRPALLSDVAANAAYRALIPETRSQLSVPIRREAETLGVITLESPEPNAFGDDDITFVTQLATQAAIAIDNARLFKRIAEGRDRLQVILDSMTEGVLLIDSGGEVALANPRMESLLGLRPATLVGRHVDELLQDTGSFFAAPMGFTPGELRLLLADMRDGHLHPESLVSHSYTLEGTHRVYISRHIAPVRDASGALLGLLMVFMDETEQQELTRAREDLSRMIVHDLRGPLTAITASLKLLNDLVPDDAEFAPTLKSTTEASMRAVRKLLNLVDSLLDIARMESGRLALEREPVELSAIVTNVTLEMDSLAQELDVTLGADVPFDLPTINVDREQIERVLLNLVDNALKFTPAEGEVFIRAYVPDDESAPAEFIRVEVSDTGPGVPDEYKDRLFDRFVQVEDRRGRRRGTGLGLTFCRLAVEAHGGHIWVEDNPAGGAVFAFTLPVADLSLREDDHALPADDELSGPLL